MVCAECDGRMKNVSVPITALDMPLHIRKENMVEQKQTIMELYCKWHFKAATDENRLIRERRIFAR